MYLGNEIKLATRENSGEEIRLALARRYSHGSHASKGRGDQESSDEAEDLSVGYNRSSRDLAITGSTSKVVSYRPRMVEFDQPTWGGRLAQGAYTMPRMDTRASAPQAEPSHEDPEAESWLRRNQLLENRPKAGSLVEDYGIGNS